MWVLHPLASSGVTLLTAQLPVGSIQAVLALPDLGEWLRALNPQRAEERQVPVLSWASPHPETPMPAGPAALEDRLGSSLLDTGMLSRIIASCPSTKGQRRLGHRKGQRGVFYFFLFLFIYFS